MLSTFLSYSVARKSRAETPSFLLPNAPHSVLIITCTTNKQITSQRQTNKSSLSSLSQAHCLGVCEPAAKYVRSMKGVKMNNMI